MDSTLIGIWVALLASSCVPKALETRSCGPSKKSVSWPLIANLRFPMLRTQLEANCATLGICNGGTQCLKLNPENLKKTYLTARTHSGMCDPVMVVLPSFVHSNCQRTRLTTFRNLFIRKSANMSPQLRGDVQNSLRLIGRSLKAAGNHCLTVLLRPCCSSRCRSCCRFSWCP